MDTVLSNVAGKNIEDLSLEELKAIAAEAGYKAYDNAKKQGFPVTELQNGKLIWIYPDGRIEPVED